MSAKSIYVVTSHTTQITNVDGLYVCGACMCIGQLSRCCSLCIHFDQWKVALLYSKLKVGEGCNWDCNNYRYWLYIRKCVQVWNSLQYTIASYNRIDIIVDKFHRSLLKCKLTTNKNGELLNYNRLSIVCHSYEIPSIDFNLYIDSVFIIIII